MNQARREPDPRLCLGWERSWDALGIRSPDGAFDDVITGYQRRQGGYHDLDHLCFVVALFNEYHQYIQCVGETGIALFYHDFVYVPGRSDNERKSADTAAKVMREAGARSGEIDRVSKLIMATCHDAVPEEPDARCVVDIDLAILGSDEETYRRYVRGVRREYEHVPDFLFRRGRRKLMEAFLAREHIYQVETFRQRFEAKARENIARELRGEFRE